MRKPLSLMSVLLVMLLLVSSIAYASSFDFSKYSDVELIEMEAAIQAEKISRGLAKSASISAGKYTIGVDIPAGTYRIETEKGSADHLYVYNSNGKRVASYAIGTAKDRGAIGKIELEDGYTVEWDSCTVKFIVYSGGIVFE